MSVPVLIIISWKRMDDHVKQIVQGLNLFAPTPLDVFPFGGHVMDKMIVETTLMNLHHVLPSIVLLVSFNARMESVSHPHSFVMDFLSVETTLMNRIVVSNLLSLSSLSGNRGES